MKIISDINLIQERKEREKKGRAARVQEVNFTAAPLVQRGGNRGGRNAGRGDRRDRQPRNDKQVRNELDSIRWLILDI